MYPRSYIVKNSKGKLLMRNTHFIKKKIIRIKIMIVCILAMRKKFMKRPYHLQMKQLVKGVEGETRFGSKVKEPQRYGVKN